MDYLNFKLTDTEFADLHYLNHKGATTFSFFSIMNLKNEWNLINEALLINTKQLQ